MEIYSKRLHHHSLCFCAPLFPFFLRHSRTWRISLWEKLL